MMVQREKQHDWLQQLVGEWEFEVEAQMAPDQPAETFTGSETVRTIGDIWIVAEGAGEMPGGGTATTMLTLGYDPQKKSFVGTWLGSMMTHLWVYEGSLDAAGKMLTLSTEGPMCAEGEAGPTRMVKAREVIEIKGPDERTFTSFIHGDDDQWTQLMTATYRRVK